MSVVHVTPANLRTRCATAIELGQAAKIHTTHPTRDYLVIDNEIAAWSEKANAA